MTVVIPVTTDMLRIVMKYDDCELGYDDAMLQLETLGCSEKQADDLLVRTKAGTLVEVRL